MARAPAHQHTSPRHKMRAPLNGAADAAAPSTVFQHGGKQQEHAKSKVKKIQSTRENKSCWAGGEQQRLEAFAARRMSLLSLHRHRSEGLGLPRNDVHLSEPLGARGRTQDTATQTPGPCCRCTARLPTATGEEQLGEAKLLCCFLTRG